MRDRVERLRCEESKLWDRVEPSIIARQILGIPPDVDTQEKIYRIHQLRKEILSLEQATPA